MIYGEKRPGIREIIYALDEERQWLKLVRQNGKAYAKLIDFFLSLLPIDEDSGSASLQKMTVAMISAQVGEKPSVVNKWFRQIYTDIFDLNEKRPELFVNPGELMCSLSYYNKQDNSGFWFNIGVKSIPKVGDIVDFYFPKAVTDSSSFIVKDISHVYKNGMMEIQVQLGKKYFRGSSYRKLLIDKALFLGLISLGDAYDPEYALDEKLMKLFKSGAFDFI